MKTRFAEWLDKPRYWVAYLLLANFAAWGVLGLGVFVAWSLLR